VFKLILYFFFLAFCVQCPLVGHLRPEYTVVHDLRGCAQSVSYETLMISRHMTGLSAFNSSGRLLYCTLYFSNSAIKKNSGAVRSGERGGQGTSPKRDMTRCGNKREAQPC